MSFFSNFFKKRPNHIWDLHDLIRDAINKKGTSCDLNFIDVSLITDMSHLFEGSEFNGDISQWDVSNVISMEKMFNKSKFTGDISQWNVSKVKNMESMFESSSFNGDISQWNVSNVTNMRMLFYDSEFKGDISNWNVSKVTNMEGMFGNIEDYKCDLSKWNVSKVTRMKEMFGRHNGGIIHDILIGNGCNIGDFSSWDISNVSDDVSSLFRLGGYSKNEILRITNKLLPKIFNAAPKDSEDLKKIIKELSSYRYEDVDLNFIDVSKITDMSHLFEGSHFNGNISKWDVSNVTNMENMFHHSRFEGDISNWNVANVNNMRGMFSGDSYNPSPLFDSRNPFNGDISKWDVSNVTNMENMFYNSRFEGDISNWNVSNVKYMSEMFSYSEFNGDISRWNVSNVINMDKMFEGSSFKGDTSQWKIYKVEDFTDPRDGEIYRTCRIGNQIWMAENLRYRCKKGGSDAYNNDASNVQKYGRLYKWDVAKEACPPGWHIPSKEEYEAMVKYVKKEYDVGDALRSVEWNDGMDVFGFSAVPSGYYGYSKSEFSSEEEYFDTETSFYNIGNSACLWVLSDDNREMRWILSHESWLIDDIHDRVSVKDPYYLSEGRRHKECSIRCIKD